MTDDDFPQPIEGADRAPGQDTPPIPMPGVPGAAHPLPPVEPSPVWAAESGGTGEQLPGEVPPTGPTTPVAPAGMPYGSYALGALAGNPQLGAPSGAGFGGPPTNPGYSGWAPPHDPAAPRPAGRRGVGAVIGLAAVVALAAGVGIGHVAWTSNAAPVSASAPPLSTPSTGSGPSGSGANSPRAAGPSDVSAIADKVDPGLVDVDTSLGYQQEEAAGTGIVLTPSGEILTNNHVISGATSISVTDVGNGKTYSASVVGYNRTKDVAVLQLHGASGLQTATIGDSSQVSVGEDVVGIGNAGGTGGTPSAAGGTVTALDQSITASDDGNGSSEQLTGLIQTNANIMPGDSGGSLVDTSGQVIGIDTAASDGFSFQPSGQSEGNQGFAIPINAAISIAKQIEAGTASSTIHIGATAFLGVDVAQGSCEGNGFGFGPGGGNGAGPGALICSVVTSAPAQEAGLAPGDLITSFNNQTIDSSRSTPATRQRSVGRTHRVNRTPPQSSFPLVRPNRPSQGAARICPGVRRPGPALRTASIGLR
jgi:S1-C subfamily serine protease